MRRKEKEREEIIQKHDVTDRLQTPPPFQVHEVKAGEQQSIC